MSSTIKFSDVQAALAKCLADRPANKHGGELSYDAQRLSELFGLMVSAHASEYPADKLSPDQAATLQRWSTSQ